MLDDLIFKESIFKELIFKAILLIIMIINKIVL